MLEFRELGQSPHDLPDGHTFEWSPRIAEEQSVVIAIIIESSQFRIQRFAVILNGLLRRFAYGYQPFTIAFAVNQNHSKGFLVVMDSNGPDFRGTQTRGIHELDHGTITQPQSSCGRVGGLE